MRPHAGRGVLASLVASLAAMLLGGPMPLPSLSAQPVLGADEGTCPDAWHDDTVATNLSLYDVHVLAGGRAVAVGSERRGWGDRSIASRWWDGEGWTSEVGPAATGDRVLLGVAGSLPDRLWAVGYVEQQQVSAPLAVRRDGGTWRSLSPPRPGSGAEVLNAVDVDPAGGVWAVGLHVSGGPARRALVWERRQGRWVRHGSLGVGAGTSLSAVLALASDDVWAVGSRTSGRAIRPLVLHWDGERWDAQGVTGVGTEAVLTSLAGTRGSDVWAAGWRVAQGTHRPLVLRRSDGAWTVVPPPDLGATALLTDVSLDVDGRPWVVGTAMHETGDQFRPVAAQLDADGWRTWPRPPGRRRWFAGVSGELARQGWAVGRAHVGSVLVRACQPAAASASAAAGASGSAAQTASASATASATAGIAAAPASSLPAPTMPGTSASASPTAALPMMTARPLPLEGVPPPRRGLRAVPPLEPAAALTGVLARDVADEVGLGGDRKTHSATVADLDGDGRKDLFISEHGGRPSLWLRRAGGYEKQPSGFYRRVDRHDCDVARIDPGPLPDVICIVGAERGLGFKADEIWIDPVSGDGAEEGVARGIADPLGRGRTLALFDADSDGDPDLFLGNQGLRYDGQPSPSRLLLNDGTGHFRWDPRSGLTSDRGAQCVEHADLDRDGDQDLVVCSGSGGILPTAGITVYRNDRGRFRAVTGAVGVGSIGELDVAVAQLGGSRRPDLVQLSRDRIRISLWSNGRYVPVYERAVRHGWALAVGDANGDGARDIYLQRGVASGINDPDLLLINRGSGRSWTPVAIPSTSRGTAEDVVALDHDRNGLADFLVLNGWKDPGPVQLIAFYRAADSGSGPAS